MALKYSTGLRNFLVGEGSLRKAFEDAVLNITRGLPRRMGMTLQLGSCSLKSRKQAGPWLPGRGRPRNGTRSVIGSHAEGHTFPFALTVDGVGPTTFTYTNTPDAGDAEAVAKAIARILNDLPQLMAIAEGANGALYVQPRIDDLDFTLADAGGGPARSRALPRWRRLPA